MPEQLRIKLEDQRMSSLNFQVSDSTLAGKEELPVKIGISTAYNYDQKMKRITVAIRVATDENEGPFLLNIEYQGLFLLNKKVTKKEMEPFARINCPAILFPFVRECVADITRRAGFNALILPAINFVELAKESNHCVNKKKVSSKNFGAITRRK